MAPEPALHPAHGHRPCRPRSSSRGEPTVHRRQAPRLLALLAACGLSVQAWAAPAPQQPMTKEARQVFEWVARSKDNEGLPFMIIDKRQAHVWVFGPAGQLKGDAPVLLGLAKGDHSLPGIGEMKLSQIRPEDR